MAGCSGTPLWKKLGFKEDLRVRTSRAPDNYNSLLGAGAPDVTLSNRLRNRIDIWHFFTASESKLRAALPGMMAAINRGGAIWISWPKKSSGAASTVTEDVVREVALPLGLVDVKVCAVDDTWSGLKLVIRKELR